MTVRARTADATGACSTPSAPLVRILLSRNPWPALDGVAKIEILLQKEVVTFRLWDRQPMNYYEVEPYRGPKAVGSPTRAIAVTAGSPEDAALLILGEVLSLSGSPAQARAKVTFVETDGAKRTVTLYATVPSQAG